MKILEIFDAFNTDIAKLPQWVQMFLNIMGPLMVGSILVLLFSKSTRKLAGLGVILFILGVLGVVFLYAQMGMVRLLGLGHIVFWGPLIYLFVNRLRTQPPAGLFKIAMIVLVGSMGAVLAFDVLDVARWVIGERGLTV